MSQEIDNRIVKIEFDNAKFEQNVQKSLGTLDRLKRSLNFDRENKGLRLFQKKTKEFNLNDIGSAVEGLEKKFSAFGVTGMTVVSELTKSFMNLGKTLTSVITSPIKQAASGGWKRAMNIKDAEFSLKGLGIMGKQLEDIKDDINYAVSGTAFGYDEAAKAASQFVASNVEVGESMKAALRAVSGVAAQTNSEYTDIAQIFTNIAANNQLYRRDLQSLSARGLNATAVLAKAMGTTEAAVQQMTKEGEIDFATFAEAMDNAFGEHATKANETFEGALRNMKSALSRIGANFADPIIDAERDVFNAFRDIFNSLNWSKDQNFISETNKEVIANAGSIQRAAKKIIPSIEGTRNKIVAILNDKGTFTAFNNLVDGVTNLILSFQKAAGAIKRAWRQVFPKKETDTLAQITDRFKQFTKSLMLSKEGAEDVQAAFRGLFSILNTILIPVKYFFKLISVVAKPALKFLGKALAVVGDAFMWLDYAVRVVEATIVYTIQYFKNLMGVTTTFGDVIDVIKGIVKSFGETFKKIFEKLGPLVLKGFAAAVTVVVSAFVGLLKVIETIKPLFSAIWNVVRAVGEKIGDLFKRLGESILGFGDNIDASPLMQFFTFLGNISTKAINVLTNGLNGLADAIRNVKVARTDKDGKGGLENSRKQMQEVGQETDKTAKSSNKFKDTLVKIGKTLKDVFGKAKELFSEVGGGIKDFFADLSLGKLAALAMVAAISALAFGIFKILSSVATLVTSVSSLTSSIKNVVDVFHRTLKPLKQWQERVVAVSVAIAVLAGSVYLLSRIDTDKLIVSGMALLFIATTMMVFANVMKSVAIKLKATKSGLEFMSMLGMFMALGGALALVAMSLESFNRIDTSNMLEKIGFIASVFGIMLASAVTLNHFRGQFSTGALTLLLFAISFKTVAKMLQQVGEIDVGSAAIAIGGIIAILFVMSKALSTEGKEFSKPRTFVALIAMFAAIMAIGPMVKAIKKIDFEAAKLTILEFGACCVALLILAGILKVIKMSNTFEMIAKQFAALAMGVSIAIAALALSMRLMGDLDPAVIEKGKGFILQCLFMYTLLAAVSMATSHFNKQIRSLGVNFMAAAIAVNLLLGAIYIIGSMDQSMINKAMGTITKLMMLFAIIEASASIGTVMGGKPIYYKQQLAILGSIIGLIGALVVLSFFPTEKITSTLTQVCTLLLVFAVATRIMFSTDFSSLNLDNAGAVSGAAFALVAAIGVLALLAMQPIAQIKAAALAACGLILAIGISMKLIFKTFKDIPSWAKVGAPVALLWSLIGGIAIILGGLWALTEYSSDFNAIKSAIVGVCALILTLGLVTAALTKVSIGASKATGTIFEILALCGGVAAIIFAMSLLAQNDWQSILATAAAAIGVVIAIGALAIALSNLGKAIKVGPAIAAIGKLLLIAAVIELAIAALIALGVALVWGLGELYQIINDASSGELEKGINAFGKMLYNIGNAFGQLVAGFGAAAASCLPDVGSYLGQFMENAAPFFDGLQKYAQEDTIAAAKNMVELMIKLIEFVVLTSVFSGFMGDFTSTLRTFDEKGNELTRVQSSFDQIGDLLTGLGEGMKSLYESTKDIEDTKRLKEITDALLDLMMVVDAMPKTGGVDGTFGFGGLLSFQGEDFSFKKLFAGVAEIGDFSDDIVIFAKAIKAFADEFKDFDPEPMNVGIEAAKKVTSVAQEIPDCLSLWSAIFGGYKDLGSFAEDMTLFADGLTAFAIAARGLQEGDIAQTDLACAMATKISDMASNLPAEGGIWAFGTTWGRDNFKSFSTNLASFAKGIVAFSESIACLNTGSISNVDAAMDMANKIAEMANSLSSTYSSAWLWTGIYNRHDKSESGVSAFDDFIKSFKKLGKGINDLVKNVKVKPEQINTAKTAILAISSLAAMIPNLQNIGTGAFETNVLSQFSVAIGSLGSSLNTYYNSVKDLDLNDIYSKTMTIRTILAQFYDIANKAPDGSAENVKLLAANFIATTKNIDDLNKRINKLTNLDETKVATLMYALDIYGKITTKVPEKGVGNGWSGVGEALSNMAIGYQNMSRILNGTDGDLERSKVAQFKQNLDALSLIGSNTSLVGKIKNVTAALNELPQDYNAIGKGMIGELATGMKTAKTNPSSGYDSINAVFSTLLDDAFNTYGQQWYDDAKKAGQDVIRGLVEGLKDSKLTKQVEDAATDLASKSTIDAFNSKKGSDSHSPSRKMIKAGRNIGEGLIIGINESSKSTERSGIMLANSITAGFCNTMEIHSPSQTAFAWAQNIVAGLVQGAQAKAQTLVGTGRSMAQDVIEGWSSGNFMGGLMNAIGEVSPAIKNSGLDLYKNIQDALGLEGTGSLTDQVDELTDSLGDMGSTGSGALGDIGSAASDVKWELQDIYETIQALFKIFKQRKYAFDPFNTDNLKNGLVTNKYLLASVKSDNLSYNLQAYAGKIIKALNKEIAKSAKGLKGDAYDKAVRSITKRTIKNIEKEVSYAGTILTKMTGSKKVFKNLTTYSKTFSGAFQESFNMSKKFNGKTLKSFKTLGEYLYKNSDAWKEDKKEAKSLSNQYEKLTKKAEKYRAIAEDKNASASEKQRAKKELVSISQSIDELDKRSRKLGKRMGKAQEKALKKYRNEIKKTIKEYYSLSNLNLQKLEAISPNSKIEASTALQDTGTAADFANTALSNLANTVSGDVKTAFDIFNVTTDSGINMLEKFSKVSTTTVRRLMINAKSQLKAYQEFQNGIETLTARNLDQSMVDDLKSQGPAALSTIRGFLKMTDAEIAEYNSLMAQKHKYDADAMEKSLNDQISEYTKYYENIEKLAAQGLSEGIIKKLKDAGVEQAAFVDALLNNPSKISSINDIYAKSIDLVKTEDTSDLLPTEQTHKTLLEALKAATEERQMFDNAVATLKAMGLGEDLIEYVKTLGTKQVIEIAKQIGTALPEEITAINEEYWKTHKSPTEVLIENMTSNLDFKQKYDNAMAQLAASLKNGKNNPLYEWINSMGMEDGMAYANAYLAANAKGQKAIRDAYRQTRLINEEESKKAAQEELEKRISDTQKYMQNMKKLSTGKYKDIISVDLWNQLVEGGPEALEQTEILLSMSIDEFRNYNRRLEYATSALPDQLATVLTNGANRVANANDTMVEGLDKDGKTSKKAKEKNKKVANSAVDGTVETLNSKESKKKVKAAASGNADSIADGTAESLNNETNRKKVKAAGEELGKAGKNGVKEHLSKSKGEKIGTNFAAGLINGMEGSRNFVCLAAYWLGQSMVNSTKAALDEHSPSKVAEQIALNFDLGIVNGLEDGQMQVVRQANQLSGTLVDTFETAWDLSKQLNQNEMNFRLTPSFDLSDAVARVSNLNGMFNKLNDVNLNINRDANKDVVKAMNEMSKDVQSRFEGLESAITDMQIVMDSGALVGSIVEPMDNALGRRMSYTKRRI